VEKFYQQCDPGELARARARAPLIPRTRASISHDSVAFALFLAGNLRSSRRLTGRFCVIFVFVAERRKLFVDLALVWVGLASLFDPIPGFLREFVLCWFLGILALKFKAKLLCFLPQAEKLGRNYYLLVWCFDPVAD